MSGDGAWLDASEEEVSYFERQEEQRMTELTTLNKDGREVTFEKDLPTVRYLADTLGVYWMSDWNRAEEMRTLGYLVRLPDDSYAVKREQVEF